jgi:hypothetical protein
VIVKKIEGNRVQGDDKPKHNTGVLVKGKQKLLEPLWGEREPFGKFSKDGSVIACMKRKQKPVATLGKKTKVGV